MCGIVGMISRKVGGFWHSDLEAFKSMLTIDMLRGDDSTGAYCVHKDGGAGMVKIGAHAMHLFMTNEWAGFKQEAINKGHILVGHNRKATKGAVNSKNAHPFHEGKYVLVHNGTLIDHAKWKTGKEVDSHALCQAFNEHGHENVIPEIEGAFALAFYNLETELFHLIRNGERPLGFVNSKEMIGFASEPWMATAAMGREKMTIDGATAIEPGELWTFGIKEGEDCKKIKLHTKVYQSNFTAADYDEDWRAYRSQHGQPVQRPQQQQGGGQSASNFPSAPTRISQNIASTLHGKPPYTIGTKVQFFADKIVEDKHPNTGKSAFKAVGFIELPDQPRCDAVGWLDESVKAVETSEYLNSPMTAKVDWYSSSTCGLSAWVEKIELDEGIYLWNTRLVGQYTWEQIVDKEKCTKCGSKFHLLEAQFTSVNNGKYTCAKCIGDSLDHPDHKERFFKRRNAAIQSGKSIREIASSPALGIIQSEGTPTVH